MMDAAGHEGEARGPSRRATGLAAALARQPLPPGSRILDIFPREAGRDTTLTLLAQPGVSVDVVAASPEDAAVLRGALGDRVGHAAAGLYDLIVISPTLGDTAAVLREAGWLAERLLRPGGRLMTLTPLPRAGAEGRTDPAPEAVIQAHAALKAQAAFGTGGLPRDVARVLRAEGVTPRTPGSRSWVGWLTLRRRMRVGRRPAGFQRDADAFLAQAPLFEWDAARDVLAGLPDAGFDAQVVALMRGRRFDSLMVSHNAFADDPRVARTAAALDEGRLLTLGFCASETGDIVEHPGAAPLILLPDVRERLSRRLRLIGRDLDPLGRRQLRLAVAAAHVRAILERLTTTAPILHTHDFVALYVGGAAVEGMLRPPRWLHDVHEYVLGYELIAADAQAQAGAWETRWLPRADALTTVSPELAAALRRHHPTAAPPAVVLSAPSAEEPSAPDAPDLRAAHGVGPAPMILHVGSLRAGRGVEHVIAALAHLPEHHLMLIGGARPEYRQTLDQAADAAGVAARVHHVGYQPPALLPTLTAQGDIGVIPVDRYGNADVALPNKLFLYLQAGLPVVATPTPALTHFMARWPVGVLTRDWTAEAMADAIRAARRAPQPVDLGATVFWEAQAATLQALYQTLRQGGDNRDGAIVGYSHPMGC